MLRRYVHGPGADEPIVWYEGSGTADRRFLHADERGSIIAVTNSSGGVVGINRYDDYGIPASTNIGRFQYTGQAWVAELGMYSYKARMYSPTLGRFMQTDPIGYGDGMNWYAYVGNDPVNKVDPSGLCNQATGSGFDCPPLDVTGSRYGWWLWAPGGPYYTPPSRGGSGGSGGSGGLSGLLNRAKKAFCSIGSFEFGGDAATAVGAGIRYSGAFAYNTSTGDLFVKGSFGGGLGLGGGFSGGLSAQSGTTSAGIRGTLDTRVSLGAGLVGGDFSYNHSTIEGGRRLGSQGASGSFGVAKGFGTAYAAVLEANLAGAKK